MYLPNVLYLLTGALFAGSAVVAYPHKQPNLLQDGQPGQHPLVVAINSIAQSTESLGNTISERPINLIKGAVIQIQCWAVARKMKSGIQSAQDSKPMNMSDAFGILVATEDLVDVVNKTMTEVIKAHPVFASLPLIPLIPFIPHMDLIVLKNLERQSYLSTLFGDSVLAKVPKAGRQDGKDRLDKIAQSFAQAISLYQT